MSEPTAEPAAPQPQSAAAAAKARAAAAAANKIDIAAVWPARARRCGKAPRRETRR